MSELALRPSGVPAELAQYVRVETDESGAYRSVVLADQIHEHFNVLLPTAEIARAVPEFTPSFRAVRLDPARHTYRDPAAGKGTASLNKHALLALANVAGLGTPQTRRLPHAELGEGKIGWQATVVVRRSDGTDQPMTASKIVDVGVEREKVAAGVRRAAASSDPKWDEARQRAEFARRWLYEREHLEAKAETKAIERAIRAALQIPHAFAEADLAKPFLVVGYNFTPDYSDPEIRRVLVERRLGAQQALYGSPGKPEGPRELPPATVAGPGDPPPREQGARPPAPESPAAESPPAAGALPHEIAAAGLHVVTFGKYAGLTLDQIAGEGRGDPDPGYVVWLATAMEPRTDASRAAQSAARVYAQGLG